MRGNHSIHPASYLSVLRGVMINRFALVFPRFVRESSLACRLAALLCVCISSLMAFGQQVAFTPGSVSVYAGTVNTSKTESPANYVGAVANLVMGNPVAMQYDAQGNLFILEGSPGNILRVVASGKGPIPSVPSVASPQAGTVYTVAGDTTQGNGTNPCSTATDTLGDGCLATQGNLSNATFMSVDPNGNLFFVDSQNAEIRVVYAQGDLSAYPSVPANPQAGYVYLLSPTYPSGSTDGFAVDANENLFFFDTRSYAISVIYAGGAVPGLTTTPAPVKGTEYALTATRPLCRPAGSSACAVASPISGALFRYTGLNFTFDPSGNLYITDNGDYMLRVLYAAGTIPGISNPQVGWVYTVAGNGTQGNSGDGGPAVQASLNYFGPITFDPSGAIYIPTTLAYDHVYDLVRKVDPSGNISTVYGNTNAFICALATDTIGDGCPATQVIGSPSAAAFGPFDGNLYLVDNVQPPGASSPLSLIREVSLASTGLSFSGAFGVPFANQTVTVTNVGTSPLALSGITFSNPDFAQVSSGSDDCSSSSVLAEGGSCQIVVSFTAPGVGTVNGMLEVASNSKNATNGNNTVTLTGTVVQGVTTTAVTVTPGSPGVANVGQPVTFTATVSTGANPVKATGTITFTTGSTTLGTGTITNSVATYTTSGLSAGQYPIVAVYGGDTNFSASTSLPATVTVSATPAPLITLTASPSAANSGQSVTLTATAEPFPSGGPVPTGTVIFEEGGSSLGTATLDSTGKASISTATLPTGPNTLLAVYGGDGHYAANASLGIPVTVTGGARLSLAPGIISRVAGNYSTSTTVTGEGGPATATQILPWLSTSDPDGNLYFYSYNSSASGNAGLFIGVVPSGKGSIAGLMNPTPGNMYLFANYNSSNAFCSLTACDTPNSGPAEGVFGDVGGGLAAGIWADAFHNVYVSAGFDGVVRKISATGAVTSVAGTLPTVSHGSYGGDGALATNAQLDSPAGVVTDNVGNLYIADMNNNLVRRVDAVTGIITTVAGTTTGAGVYSSNSTPESLNACTNTPCGDGGPATSATLRAPTGVALDSAGNLYIADAGDNAVRLVDAKTGVITSFAGLANPKGSGYSGDGSAASAALLKAPTGVAVDAGGNVYIADGGNDVVREVNAQSGVINTIAGNGTACADLASLCGDGGLATNAQFSDANGVSLDAQGNIYVADRLAYVVRQVTASTSAIVFGSSTLGTITGQAVTVTNSGDQPLTLTGITLPTGFTQAASGGTDCSASTTLTPGSACTIDVQFFPTAAQAYSGTMVIASNAVNGASGQNTVSLSGTGVANGGNTAQSINFPTPPAPYYWGASIPLSAVASSGRPVDYLVTTGPGIIVNNGTASAALKIVGTGSITVTAYQFGDVTYSAATPQSVTLTAAQPVLTITANNESFTKGSTLPAYTTYTASGFIGSDSQSTLTGQPVLTVVDSHGTVQAAGSTPEAGIYTINIIAGTLAVPTYYVVNFVPGTLTVSGTNAQTISFSAVPANVTYGVLPITLAAVANDAVTGQPDGLPITYSITGPATVAGNILTITGSGTVVITANQVGSSLYIAVSSASQTIYVSKAALSVTANNLTLSQGVALPSLSTTTNYAFTGFQNGDNATAISGSPVLTVVDAQGITYPAGSTLPLGTYTIAVNQGSLAAANYSFSPVNGTLHIVQGQTQTISFPQLPAVTYGASPFTLGATASSGLGVTYTVSPSNLATVTGNQLAVNGAGTITIAATQAGNNTYAPATATQSLVVAPAVLIVTATNTTRPDNTVNPVFAYTVSGFVNGDTQLVLSGTAQLTTPATPESPAGTYPINVAQGTLGSANYTYNFVSGTLTVTSNGPAADFTVTASPQQLTILSGAAQQTTITLSTVNYYHGLVTLSCGNLPAKVTCLFTPPTLTPDGSGTPVTVQLVVNTSGTSTVVGQVRPFNEPTILSAGMLWLPAGLLGALLAFQRKRFLQATRANQLLMLLLLLAGAAAMAACGGNSSLSSSSNAAIGTSTITVTATGADGTTHAIPLSITVK